MLSATAHAKVTLFLHITGKRDDGYHLLDALVGFTQAGDTVTVKAADELSLEVDGRFAEACGNADDNLVLRAAKLLKDHANVEEGAKITLTKNLPVAAGLGGGSSDAAATLKLLCKLWNVPMSVHELAELALPLGADLPVCVFAAPARMSGIGEVIQSVDSMAELPILLVNPNVPLSTPEVYNHYTHVPSPYVSPQIKTDDAMALLVGLDRTHNHLQRAAIICDGIVAEVLLELETQFDCYVARLCGSGATCYALFEHPQSMARAAAAIRKNNPDWWVCETKLLPRAAWAVK